VAVSGVTVEVVVDADAAGAENSIGVKTASVTDAATERQSRVRPI
jgi:hypothetical protein